MIIGTQTCIHVVSISLSDHKNNNDKKKKQIRLIFINYHSKREKLHEIFHKYSQVPLFRSPIFTSSSSSALSELKYKYKKKTKKTYCGFQA